ncbi:cytochrome P450 [Sinosporangium siamense]|uniref:Cytochrome P450 n=1 Tax=Sinosporangium siamense TaxID=1367973 RepID=A0A919RLF6_9ACTN|nr:cytochrome P450 [Sinosporangium siamense]GII95000.1 hypothetical protein Ssi02_52310 [Sinosporangium siamense]
MSTDEHTTSESFLERYDKTLTRDPMAAFDLVRGWMRADWRALFAELRLRRPVFVTPAFTVVTRFADVTEVLAREDVFTVRPFGPRLEAALGGPFMLSRDATPMNWREKALMQVMLDRDDIEAVRELAGRLTEEALDAAVPYKRLEAVHELFRPVTLGVSARYFGVPGPDPQTLSRWIRAVITDGFANFTGDLKVQSASVLAGAELMAYLRDLLARRRADLREGRDVPDDVVTRLAGISLPAGLSPDDERVAINMAGLPLGFVESGTGAMAAAVEQLLLRPAVFAEAVAVSGDPKAFDPYVWEAVRFDPFFKLLPRLCERDYVLAAGTPRRTVIRAGTLVFASPAAAMFDEEVVEEPEEFRVGRPDHHYLFFGHGHHACLGTHPAKAVICEVVRRLLSRPGLRLESPVVHSAGVFPEECVLGFEAFAADGRGA